MRVPTRSRHLAAALAATLAVGAAACGDTDAETSSFADVPVQTENAGETTTTDGDDDAVVDIETKDGQTDDGQTDDGEGPVVSDEREEFASDEAVPPPAAVTGDPIVTVDGSGVYPSLDVLDLRRDGDTLTLEFAIHTRDGGRPSDVEDVFAAEQDTYYGLLAEGVGIQSAVQAESRTWVSGVTLVDRDNANRHLVLRDSSGACLCTSFPSARLEWGEPYRHSAQFPAPPEDVTSMTVEVPNFPSVDNVPIRAAG